MKHCREGETVQITDDISELQRLQKDQMWNDDLVLVSESWSVYNQASGFKLGCNIYIVIGLELHMVQTQCERWRMCCS